MSSKVGIDQPFLGKLRRYLLFAPFQERAVCRVCAGHHLNAPVEHKTSSSRFYIAVYFPGIISYSAYLPLTAFLCHSMTPAPSGFRCTRCSEFIRRCFAMVIRSLLGEGRGRGGIRGGEVGMSVTSEARGNVYHVKYTLIHQDRPA